MREKLTVSAAAVFALILFNFTPFSHSQEGSVATLDEITVYATRSFQLSFDVPASVSKVVADSPGAALSSDMAGLLEFTPGVETEGGPRAGIQTISIRGFDDEAVVTLIDGRRQNFESGHDGRFFLDPSLLKSVEVVRGASSAIYGGGAIGGVVAFETKDAADLLAPGEIFGALTSFGYRSSRDEISPSLAVFGMHEGWDLLASVAFKNSGDIKHGGAGRLETKDEPLSFLFKAAHTFLDYHTLKIQGSTLTSDGRWPNNGGEEITVSNPVVDKHLEDDQFSLKYSFSDPANRWFAPVLHLYRNETELEETDIAGENAGRAQTRKLETVAFTADSQTRLAPASWHGHTFSYGFEIYKDEQTGSRVTADGENQPRPGVPDAESLKYGFYFQDEMSLDLPIGKIIAIGSIRYDNYENTDSNVNCEEGGDKIPCPELDEGEWSPKFALTYKPIEQLMFFGSWARAFRGPTMTELYSSGQHFPAVPCPPSPIPCLADIDGDGLILPVNEFIPNPDLKPETVSTVEFGAGLKFDRTALKGSWFHSKGDDFITQKIDVPGGATQYLNTPRAKLTGFDIEASAEFYPVRMKAGAQYVNAKDDRTGEHLTNTVPFTFLYDWAFLLPAIDGVFGLRIRMADANDKGVDEDEGEAATEGYEVFDLYFRWTPDGASLQNLTVDLGLENVFDRAYTKRFASLLEDGRGFVARVSYKW